MCSLVNSKIPCLNLVKIRIEYNLRYKFIKLKACKFIMGDGKGIMTLRSVVNA